MLEIDDDVPLQPLKTALSSPRDSVVSSNEGSWDHALGSSSSELDTREIAGSPCPANGQRRTLASRIVPVVAPRLPKESFRSIDSILQEYTTTLPELGEAADEQPQDFTTHTTLSSELDVHSTRSSPCPKPRSTSIPMLTARRQLPRPRSSPFSNSFNPLAEFKRKRGDDESTRNSLRDSYRSDVEDATVEVAERASRPSGACCAGRSVYASTDGAQQPLHALCVLSRRRHAPGCHGRSASRPSASQSRPPCLQTRHRPQVRLRPLVALRAPLTSRDTFPRLVKSRQCSSCVQSTPCGQATPLSALLCRPFSKSRQLQSSAGPLLLLLPSLQTLSTLSSSRASVSRQAPSICTLRRLATRMTTTRSRCSREKTSATARSKSLHAISSRPTWRSSAAAACTLTPTARSRLLLVRRRQRPRRFDR